MSEETIKAAADAMRAMHQERRELDWEVLAAVALRASAAVEGPLDDRTYELLSKSLDQRNEAIRGQERLLGFIGEIAHALAVPGGPDVSSIGDVVNRALGRKMFPGQEADG